MQNNLIISYMSLRKGLGVIGVLLPILVVLGAMTLFKESGIRPSLSDYYYSGMGDVFVGGLIAIGVYHLAYTGYEVADRRAGTAAGILAIMIALFPVAPSEGATELQNKINLIHTGAAGLYFAVIGYFCLKLFKKTGAEGMTARKRTRNRIYSVSGWIIVLTAILLTLVVYIESQNPLIRQWSLVLWLEIIGLTAFGIAWFVKGEGVFADLQSSSE